ncbi:tRNA lysidine(34) synthetase TilS [Erythrobacter arachoides]|uniref:tRNA(Ile)-lysidine synthase n=1 Tax=Aurantiacibacter arachoides TaxID=1850444 RepID=A0A844ZX63_9SPHN|nr:tRNA lysidine(34) synthetase TilS [Aurantiacibacter arachoides]MXO92328.1 tRNA lysidine(34) synthetase TilS [Aurantiacibacter arachoides]GGD58053.1 hypothetical protein GCM10011411_17630 [Aurantiacibacter arachoides]
MAGSTAIDPELVGRFREALERLNGGGARIGLAVSGGPDSMAMLLLAHAAIPGHFAVATVDHGLRPDAKDECALVVAACEARGVPCTVLTVTVAAGNVQAEARKARYLALGEWAEDNALPAVATAHHADDQAETLLMRLNRGSGVSGLAGVREVTNFIGTGYYASVIRPLLAFRRAELRDVVERACLAVAHDPSNEDPAFDRVRIRRALAACDWLDPLALARSANHLADAEQALHQYRQQLWEQAVTYDDGTFRMRADAGPEMALRVIGLVMRDLGGNARGADLAGLVAKLRNGQGGNVGGVLATVEGNDWVFRREPPRRTG